MKIYAISEKQHSVFNPAAVYAGKGDLVKLVADHGNVWIVEADNERFPVSTEVIINLSTIITKKWVEEKKQNQR